MSKSSSPVPIGANRLFSNGEFELPMIPYGDSFIVHGMVVAKQLGFRNAADMVRALDDDERMLIETPSSPQHANLRAGGEQGVWYLTEPGFYKVVGQRNVNLIKDLDVRATVARFQRWTFHEVVPAMVRSGQAQEALVSGVAWDWHMVSAEIRQRYGLDWKPSQVTAGARAAGWLRDGGSRPAWGHRQHFWSTGTAYLLLPHALPDLVADLVESMRGLGDPQASQYQLSIFPGREAIA